MKMSEKFSGMLDGAVAVETEHEIFPGERVFTGWRKRKKLMCG